MAGLGNPEYGEIRTLTEEELNGKSYDEILYSYVIIVGTFKFPGSVKYPSIPCFVDETTTVYPLTGSCTLTGAEYLLAKSQGCELKISEIVWLPVSQEKETETEKVINKKKGENYLATLKDRPFYRVIKRVQELRKEYPKGSINNLLYKEMGNSMYGAVVRGISDKRGFDIKTGEVKRMSGNDLSNPIMAS